MKTLIVAALVVGQWLPSDKQKHLMDFVPQGVELPQGVKFYHMPAAFQSSSNLGISIHSPKYNLAGPLDPIGHANGEFPWKVAAGLHQSSGWMAHRFAYIPGQIDWWRESGHAPFPNSPAVYRWAFPKGTMFGELLFVTDRQGYHRVFEVRTREKNESGTWDPSTYRPFAKIEELPPEARPVKKVQRVSGNGVTADVVHYEIDAIDPDYLNRPFKSSGLFLSSRQDGGITPKGYLGNVTTCTDCHSTTLKHAMEFDRRRDWYGFTRGDDTIFSFHLYDESSISYNGVALPIRLNSQLPLRQVQARAKQK